MRKLNKYYIAIFDALMHAEMAIAFCLKGVDLVEIVFDLCLRTKMFTCGFDMIFPISTVYT